MVSILLCTYNRAHTLKDTLDSILNQTYKDFELIIIDDGSTDTTQELLSKYQDSRIRIFTLPENSFYCAAANWGLQQTRGEYIAFATSDDLWLPDKLELQMRYLEKRKECGACFTFADIIDEHGKPAEEEFPTFSIAFTKNYHTQEEWVQHFLFQGNCLCHPSAIVRKDVMDEVGDYNLLYCQTADMDLWFRIVIKHPIHVLEKKLVHYRCYHQTDAQVTGNNGLKYARHINELMLIKRKMIQELSDEEFVHFFADHFRNKDVASPKELQIERAFLLLHCMEGLPKMRILGIEKFEEILHDPEIVRILKEEYHVTLQDIYAWNLEHFFVDFGVRDQIEKQEQENNALKELLRQKSELADTLQKHTAELENELTLKQEASESIRQELEQLKEQYTNMQRTLTMTEKRLQETTECLEKAQANLDAVLLEKLQAKEQKRTWFSKDRSKE